jgi:hypothetical protein
MASQLYSVPAVSKNSKLVGLESATGNYFSKNKPELIDRTEAIDSILEFRICTAAIAPMCY